MLPTDARLISKRVDPAVPPIRTSISPSPSTSLNAAPRSTSDAANAALARLLTPSNRPPPAWRSSSFFDEYRERIARSPQRLDDLDRPLTASRSSFAVVVEVQLTRQPANARLLLQLIDEDAPTPAKTPACRRR